MRKLETAVLVFLMTLASTSPSLAQPPAESCVNCHGALSDARLSSPVERFAEDIHASRGFSCVSCHGGDGRVAGLAAMDSAAGYIGKPVREEVPMLCGRCHSDAQFMRRYNPSLRVDQVAEYRTSVHGQRLFETNDPRVATCISCHPAHSIKPPSEPSSSVHPLQVAETCGSCHADSEYMEPYGIPTDQLQTYRESIHWQKLSEEGDISAPTCNDCHGNHGAAPPGVSWVGNVCGQCHSVMGRLFAGSFHSQVFTMLGTPGCATCHGNHAVKTAEDELLGLGEGAACAMCHTASDRGGDVASTMRTRIDSLKLQYELADSLLSRAEQAGIEVSQAQFDLNAATTSLVSARTAIHSFSLEAVSREVDAGLEATSEARARGREALKELQFRRMGLAVSVTFILLLIVGLVLKIREIERSSTNG